MAQLIAHRGWSGKAPENTLSAVKMALAEPKIDSIEIDVHLSKDGIPVVIHDTKVNRTTNGSGFVKDKTLAELQELDAGSWFDPVFKGEKIPTLAEVMELIDGRKKLLIELKQSANMYGGLEEKVVKLIQEHRGEAHCELISFDHQSLQLCREVDPQVKRTLVLMGSPSLLVDQVNAIGATAVSINHQYVDRQMIDSLRDNGTEIVVWTVDQQADAERILALDKRIALTTNHPDRLWS